MNGEPVPAWFHNLVIEGVQMLYALSLQGCPSAETLALTTQVWIETLWRGWPHWEEAADAGRLRDAFVRMAGAAERWPTPRQLMNSVPRRPELPKLATPDLPAEQLERNKRRISALLATMNLGKNAR